MSKRNETPTMPKRTPRLILAGGAKDRTNASGGVQIDEPEPLKPYNP